MSYILDTKCRTCELQSGCEDEALLKAAIYAIHQLPLGHKGSGIVRLDCSHHISKSRKSEYPST